MNRAFEDARRWSAQGTKLFLDTVAGMRDADDDQNYAGPSLLPGWTRRHLVAHVAANADALGNLVHWAATGEQTPMYATREERAAGIERGSRMTGSELSRLLRRSAAELAASMDRLTEQQWTTEVVTARGRTVPATEIPWLRAREVCVHAVDLGLGLSFADLPADFLSALCDDIVAERGDVPDTDGPLDQRAAWLAGRPHDLAGAPDLGAWL